MPFYQVGKRQQPEIRQMGFELIPETDTPYPQAKWR
jgi:hypothetical protein